MDFFKSEFTQPPAAIVAEMRLGAPAGDRWIPTRLDLAWWPAENVGPFLALHRTLQPFSSAPVGTLTAARVFRDCSLRQQSSAAERRACRTLMRQAAIKWRRGRTMSE